MKNIKVLFATDFFDGIQATANGICVRHIAETFMEQGDYVDVLCFKNRGEDEQSKFGTINVYRTNANLINRFRFLYEFGEKQLIKTISKFLMIFINRLQSVVFLHWYPLRTPLACYKFFKKMEELYKKNNYDLIVASYCPFEAIYATYLMKKKYDIKVCMYALDSLSAFTSRRFFLSKNFQIKKGFKWESKMYECYDLILNMEGHEEHYALPKYKRFKGKMKIVDFPHFIIGKSENEKEKLEDRTRYKLIYAGSIRTAYFDKVIDLLKIVLENGFHLDIYGGNTAADIGHEDDDLKKINIRFRGRIENERLLKLEKNAECLISMGNYGSDATFVPSKIIEYISTGNKIIHFYINKNDSCLPYFKRYSNSCLINVKDNEIASKQKIKDFLYKEINNYKMQDIREMFILNTPEYTCKVVKEYMGLLNND